MRVCPAFYSTPILTCRGYVESKSHWRWRYCAGIAYPFWSFPYIALNALRLWARSAGTPNYLRWPEVCIFCRALIRVQRHRQFAFPQKHFRPCSMWLNGIACRKGFCKLFVLLFQKRKATKSKGVKILRLSCGYIFNSYSLSEVWVEFSREIRGRSVSHDFNAHFLMSNQTLHKIHLFVRG